MNNSVTIESVTDESGTEHRVKAIFAGCALHSDWTASAARVEAAADEIRASIDPDRWADAAVPPDVERRLAPWLTNGAALHPLTINLVVRFSRALAAKLAAAEQKYGYRVGWLAGDWMDECRRELLEHVAKGDPRDVAAYCAFLWHHGESTTPRTAAPHLFELWWTEYMPDATQTEAWAAWTAVPLSRNVAIEAATPAPKGDAKDAARFLLLVDAVLNPDGSSGQFLSSQPEPTTIEGIRETLDRIQAPAHGVRCHNDACCGGQLPCPTRQACGLGPAPDVPNTAGPTP